MTPSTSRKQNRYKNFLFYGILIAIIYLITEVLAYAAYSILEEKRFSFSDTQQKRQEIVDKYTQSLEKNRVKVKNKNKKKRRGPSEEIIHPYLGYVVHFRDEDCPGYGFCDDRMRSYETDLVTEKNENNLVIGIFGGSFAYGVSNSSTKGLLSEEFKKIPQYENKEIIIHTIALGGYKQPQQLMALNYFLSMGAHFDIVINIDGFNEVALPPTENLPKDTNPYFPRVWANRVRGAQNKVTLAMIGKINYYKKKQADLAEDINESRLRYSVLINLIWKYFDERYAGKSKREEIKLTNYVSRGIYTSPFVARGPNYEVTTKEKTYKDLVQMWGRSSQQMYYISQGAGFQYYHFLQPNQYVKNSKPMSEEEKEIALIEHHPYRQDAKGGYPYLIEEGKQLLALGTPFYDLTMLFSQNHEILYRDGCCHLNTKGYDLIVKHIVSIIKNKMTNSTTID